MTPDTQSGGTTMLQKAAVGVVSVVALAVIAFVVLSSDKPDEDPAAIIRNASAHVSVVPPEGVAERADELAAWALDIAYAAAESDPAVGAAQLDQVASGDALSGLESGLIGNSGLKNAPEGFHETEILTHVATAGDDALSIAASWRPVALIADGQHRHRLGNTFTGELGFAWAEGAWRLVEISVSDIDESMAGQIVDAVKQ